MAIHKKMIVDTEPLREYVEFRWLYAGLAVAGFGRQLTIVAVPIQVFQLTRSTWLVGLLGLVQLVPVLLVSAVGGSLVDAVDRKALLIIAQVATAATAVGLALNAALDDPMIWAIFVLSAVNAGIATIDHPTRATLVSSIVSRRQLPAATALTQTLEQVSRMVGPAIGGFIIVASSVTATFVVEAVCFSLGAIFMLGIKSRPAEGEVTTFGLESIKEGWVFLKNRRLLRSNFAIDLNAMVFGMPSALFPAFGEIVLGGDESTVGLLYAAPGAGAMLAAVTSGWVGSVSRQGRAVIISVIIWGLGIAAFGLSRTIVLACIFLAIAGAADVISAVFRNTILQLAVPDNLRGRLSSIHVGISSGGPRLGDFEAGAVASLVSVPFSIVSGGIACVIGALVISKRMPELNAYVDVEDDKVHF
jgi:MFS family permease